MDASLPGPQPAIVDKYAAKTTTLLRDALKRELEAELRGLIMAARMHGFALAVEADMSYVRVLDTRPT